MKISYLILISFSVILLLFSTSTYINFRQAELVEENADKFERSSNIIENSNRFQRNFLNMVSGLRGFLLTDEESFIQTYDSARTENNEILNTLSSIVPDGSDQKILLYDIKELQSYWIEEFAKPLLKAKEIAADSRSDKTAFNRLYHEKRRNRPEKEVQKTLQRKFADFIAMEYSQRASNRMALSASVNTTRNISFFLTFISIVIGACIALFITKYITSIIVKMIQTVELVADENYEVTLPQSDHTELGRLGKSLNMMSRKFGFKVDQLRKQKEEVDQFAYIASHDLKAPLRGIDNVVSWIEEDHRSEIPEKVAEYLSIIKSRIARAENLLNAILTYARAGREMVPKENIDVNQLLLEIKYDIQRNSSTRIIIRSNMPTLYTERVPLTQIFTNLIVNAVKYHDKPDGFVKVYYKVEDDHYRFFVQDDGPGIKPVYHKKIFTIFQTLQEIDTHESIGAGLAIVKKILDERKLTIQLISEPGKGSVFSFTWPAH